MPQPNVESAIIRLDIRPEPIVKVKDQALFMKLVRASFQQRRKTIWNNLRNSLEDKAQEEDLREAFTRSGIDPSRRGESLSIQEFAQLADAISESGLNFLNE